MFSPVLTKNFGLGHSASLKEYEASGGYRGLREALARLKPFEAVKIISDSGLRGDRR